MNRSVVLLALLLLSRPVLAQAPSGEAAERARIERERAVAEAEFAAREQACYARFAVNDCVEAARLQRRTVLSDLRRQEVALNDAERRRRAADRIRETEARQAEQGIPSKERTISRDLPAPPAAPSAPTPPAAPAVPSAPAAPPARSAPAVPSAPASAVPPVPPAAPAATQAPGTAVNAQGNAQRHLQRMREAELHKERVRQKAAENTKASRPLPVPP